MFACKSNSLITICTVGQHNAANVSCDVYKRFICYCVLRFNVLFISFYLSADRANMLVSCNYAHAVLTDVFGKWLGAYPEEVPGRT